MIQNLGAKVLEVRVVPDSQILTILRLAYSKAWFVTLMQYY